jgi:hypothetical protein
MAMSSRLSHPYRSHNRRRENLNLTSDPARNSSPLPTRQSEPVIQQSGGDRDTLNSILNQIAEEDLHFSTDIDKSSDLSEPPDLPRFDTDIDEGGYTSDPPDPL